MSLSGIVPGTDSGRVKSGSGGPKVAAEIFLAKKFDVTCHMSYSSCTFDENLHLHINRDLADDVGRASDTS